MKAIVNIDRVAVARELLGELMTYTTVSTVCASSLLGGLVDLDVLDD